MSPSQPPSQNRPPAGTRVNWLTFLGLLVAASAVCLLGLMVGERRLAEIHSTATAAASAVRAVAWLLLLPGLFLDGFSLVAALITWRRGHGPSGMPLVALLFYGVYVRLVARTLPQAAALAALFLALHLCCQHRALLGGVALIRARRQRGRP